jgi:hypothetical protein
MLRRALLYLQSMRRCCLQSCGRRGSPSSRQRTGASHGQGRTVSGALVAPAHSCDYELNGVQCSIAVSSSGVHSPVRPVDLQVVLFRYNQWLLHGMPAAVAYSERAAAHVSAKAFLQARADAASALHLLRMPAETAGSQVCAAQH